MDILVSWSGSSSHEIATSLREWLPMVIPGCKPWVSSEDIVKGKPWRDELRSVLANTRVILIIVTPENVKSPWVYYEAGWIAAKLDQAAVCPYLVGIPVKLLYGTPLSEFQCTEADKADTLRLIRSLNSSLESPHHSSILEGNFAAKWPSFKRTIDRVAAAAELIEDPVREVQPPISEQLSSEARQLLIAACEDSNQKAVLIFLRHLGGTHIQAGSRSVAIPDDARSVAIWKGALDQLEGFGLIEALGYKREVFEVTKKGWDVFDYMKAHPAST